jgi:hypothetical protein
VFSQSVRDSIWPISLLDDGMIDPTITGCFRNSRKNMPIGPSLAVPRRAPLRLSTCSPEGEVIIESLYNLDRDPSQKRNANASGPSFR